MSLLLALKSPKTGNKGNVVEAAQELVGPNSVSGSSDGCRAVLTLHTDHGEEHDVDKVLREVAGKMDDDSKVQSELIDSFEWRVFED